MRRAAYMGLLGSVVFISAAGFASKEQTIQDLKAREASAKSDDKVSICVDIVNRDLKVVEKAFGEGAGREGRATLSELETYAEKAHDAAVKSPRKLKPAEISLRKVVSKLNELRHTADAADQPAIDEATTRLEKLRSDMLAHMFAKD